jgi:hypothetical protein
MVPVDIPAPVNNPAVVEPAPAPVPVAEALAPEAPAQAPVPTPVAPAPVPAPVMPAPAPAAANPPLPAVAFVPVVQPQARWYVVFVGLQPGVYQTWLVKLLPIFELI